MTTFTSIIDDLGVRKVAEVCGISVRAVYKWRKANALPRTEFTGETSYSSRLSEALGNHFSAEDILEIARPRKS